jgi:hypothetical protein
MKGKYASYTCFRQCLVVLSAFLFVLYGSQLFSQRPGIDLGKPETTVSVLKDDMQQLKLKFSYERIDTYGIATCKGYFNEISIAGAYWVGDPGSPKLPASKKLIEVPFGADVFIKVLKYEVQEYKLSDHGIAHKIMPVQPSVRKDQDIESLPFNYDERIYEKDSFIEPEIVTVEILGVLRGYRIARLTVAPVSYNPAKETIRIFNNIEIEISFSGVDHDLNKYIKASTWSPYFELIGNSLLNSFGSGLPLHAFLADYPVKYLVISDRMFEAELQPFIEWKTRKGFKMVVVYTDETGSSKSAISSWVHQQYISATPDDPAPSFLLLVGDTPQIPSPTGILTGKVSDLYYASVDGDYFPEMLYGRFSASNPAQLATQIEKTIYYEQYLFSDPGFLDKTTLIAGADAFWNPRVGQPTIFYGTNNYFNTARGYTDIHTYLTSPYTGCYNAEKIAVGMINYTAHCNETTWGNPMLTKPMVNNFSNQGQYPLAIGNCCLAADFGHQESIGETWVRAEGKGAVAYIGSAPNTYWFEDFYWSVGAFPIQGNNAGYVPSFDETTTGAYDAPFISDYVSTAGLMFIGNLAVTEAHLQTYSGHSGPKYYWEAYNVLGDPSLVIYHTQGSLNVVNHATAFPMGLDRFEVEAMPGSYVALSKDGMLLGATLVDSSGFAEILIQPLTESGMVDIVVTKPQFIPYQALIPVLPLPGTHIVNHGFVINDENGNNNGLADFGETFSVHLTLKNVGTLASGILTATISGSDDYVNLISTPSLAFGLIESWEEVTLEHAFMFEVDDFIPDQHMAVFNLEISDETQSWFSNVSFTIHAPVLIIASDFYINDSQSGNNNGILDPGETALLVLNIANTGHSSISGIEINAQSNDELLFIQNSTPLPGHLDPGETAAFSLTLTAQDHAPVSYPVSLDLFAAGGPENLYSHSKSLMLVIGPVPGHNMGNKALTTCLTMFYDSGGPGGDYQNNEDISMTFYPAQNEAMVRAVFQFFDTETGFDKLHIYNGPDIMAPEFPGSPFSGTNNPGTIIAMNPEGALTFRFLSDANVTRPGWMAEISCHIATEPPVCATSPFPADGSGQINLFTELTWLSYDAASFDVYFGVTVNPPYFATINSSSFSPELFPNTTYYWKIVPKNVAGHSAGCNVWSFTTSNPAYLMADHSFAVTSGMFYDSGGPGLNYQNAEDYTITFYPYTQGYQLAFSFIDFETEAENDFLYVYDGEDITAPQLPGSPFHGQINPGVLTSSNSHGALTFHFVSDSETTFSGWEASFRCTGPLAVVPTSSPVALCAGNSAQLYAYTLGGSGEYTYFWEPQTGLNDPALPNPVASPGESILYTLTVNDGESSASAAYFLEVKPLPVVDIGNDTILCIGSTMMLDATIPDGISYYWMPGGETTPAITIAANGIPGKKTYTVSVTDINGCMAEASITITFDACTFVEDENRQFSITIFPIPARSVLNISIDGFAQDFSYSFFNHHGQIVFSDMPGNAKAGSSLQINTSGFDRGVYYMRIQTRDNTFTRKVLLH